MKSAIMNNLQQISEQNLVDIEQARENGQTAVGFYCLYSPMEIAVAGGAIPLPLCGTRNDPVAAAEETLPRNLCPLIKSSYGFAVSDTCAYFRASDIIIGDTTCDGKKKMFELLSRQKTTHVLQLPQNQDAELSMSLWRSELERFKKIIEDATKVAIDDTRLRSAISLMNRERQARKTLMDVNKAIPAPLKGTQMLEVLFKVGFLADKKMGISFMEEVTAKAREGAFLPDTSAPGKAKRILLTGVPVGLGSDKVVKIIEQLGADVVAFENCSGYKQAFTVDESKPPMEALAEQYLATPCSVMSPNLGRFALLAEMIRDFHVDGVIDLTWQACHTYNVEAFLVDEFVQESSGLPTLHLETDYAESDSEQLRVRIEAYLEML
ncbi:double-cubane-cluster-containing anaerobic reductase [Desulforhopalus singaporensis]|uniref:Benzoyl-CoA reductase/2-hydroxyglutaryl-CoA dehydratase subunit, BcrC/BadD/HgdB n=1 Tax=Desulforhopalus singaporensis TaxID=91360 RepID=A0A1H0R385_9BACT|nr:double-cubane-cluster-containing anaerobic reductase [Desulforhopalus singaporensis]SDP23609.1 Benzoyl-CoA reductase/2-hydroxyglutaryl-CoA dehydratase subunit, BcrC/BadD/HgdB [Desulforhopalus singaporensis]